MGVLSLEGGDGVSPQSSLWISAEEGCILSGVPLQRLSPLFVPLLSSASLSLSYSSSSTNGGVSHEQDGNGNGASPSGGRLVLSGENLMPCGVGWEMKRGSSEVIADGWIDLSVSLSGGGNETQMVIPLSPSQLSNLTSSSSSSSSSPLSNLSVALVFARQPFASPSDRTETVGNVVCCPSVSLSVSVISRGTEQEETTSRESRSHPTSESVYIAFIIIFVLLLIAVVVASLCVFMCTLGYRAEACESVGGG